MTTSTATPLRYLLPTRLAVARTMDARHLNEVANHPQVRPWLLGDGPIDLTETLANPANLAFETEHGGFLVLAVGQGVYDVHSLFLPEGRGHEALAAMQAGIDYMFAATDCFLLTTIVPNANLGASRFARVAGFRPTNALVLEVEAQQFTLPLDRWARQTRGLELYGQWFHATMADVLDRVGSTLPPHSDRDDKHDQIAGAATLMACERNAMKAEMFYNAWAESEGYPLIHVLREQPLIIDLGGVVVEVRGEQMEVLRCL